MTPDNTKLRLLLPDTTPGAVPLVLAVVLTALWVWLHRDRFRPFTRPGILAAVILRATVGFAALSAWVETVQHIVVLATPLPLPLPCLLGAAGLELVHWLYSVELQSVPTRAGRILVGLRAALVLLLALMLCQPILIRSVERKIDRHVAVLLDDSASMRVSDGKLPARDCLRLAEAAGVADVTRPVAFDRLTDDIRDARQQLQSVSDSLAPLAGAAPETLAGQMNQVKTAAAVVDRVLETVRRVRTATGAAQSAKAPEINDALHRRLAPMVKTLQEEADSRLPEARKHLDTAAAAKDAGQIAATLRQALDALAQTVTALQPVEADLAACDAELDQALYAALPAETRQAVDGIAAAPRFDLAVKTLTADHRDAAGSRAGSLLQRLTDDYGVRAYTFAATPAETSVDKLARGSAPDAAAESDTARNSSTDLTAALQKVMNDIPSDQLAGVLLLSDGRHNGRTAPDEIVRRLGKLKVPVCTVLFGNASHPPLDAAIANVDAPDLIYEGDRFAAHVDVKVEGVAGIEIPVQLISDGKIVDSQTVKVDSEVGRQQVVLADTPGTSGFHEYKIVIPPQPGEVSVTNNEYRLPVAVTRDKTQVLLIDRRPRWEFRYLKNLFAGRDSSVRLQYVLLHPDRTDDQPVPPAVGASVSRSAEACEATALPVGAEEWLKFDVIILGDVDPKELGTGTQETLTRFVSERGGMLVAIAGTAFMPHAYAGMPLTDLLPVTFNRVSRPLTGGPEDSYRFVLTQEGGEHVVMQLSGNAEESQRVWNALPAMYWRHPILDTKPGASVLAYACPVDPPAFLKSAGDNEVPSEGTLNNRRRFERANALVVAQHYAAGRILFSAVDQSWRLRYRSGDTYHHRFWGQILRWGTADKLLYGSGGVRIGTDKARYQPREPVRVRVRLATPDCRPIAGANVTAIILTGDRQPVARRKLAGASAATGLYETTVPDLAEGTYKVEIETDANTGNAPLPTAGFAVARDLSAETTWLAPDRELPGRIATATGGVIVAPPRIDDVLSKFGPPSLVQNERRQYDLWNSWLLLLAIAGVAIAEWALRKKVSLP
ncbi:MAG: hypothetical protein A3K19_25515 [Lentisphaerae bacterium RIFOXYB12_FULL_65_16]|nr:MAG: hypothetical protein A3K18_32555 [Lentisphaerae bacterium RIFOXYA12_64_32]OGV84851.1 MAG: hypothetical protein A3K19_25515 [Lentisphaerae bacterium RIFOXYB12_FULL_65_16]